MPLWYLKYLKGRTDMERLTVKTVVYQNGKLEIIVGMKCGVEFKDIFDRLAAYEDTGLEPEEIIELKGRMEGLEK